MMIHSSSMKFTGKLELPVLLFWTDKGSVYRSTSPPEEIHIVANVNIKDILL